jgi:hypothetical protein
MAVTATEISRELNVPRAELTQKSLLAYLERELRLAEEDIADMREKYLATSRQELEKNIKSRKIYSHPAWEDLIAWENTEEHISKLKKMLGSLRK